MSTRLPTQRHAARNWFDQGGRAYAQFRPEYPAALADHLASISTGCETAVDVGCGNGQLTCLLANHFGQTIGIDPSADQIAHAVPASGVSYFCAPAENIPLGGQSADLITAAQAAHWFKLDQFYSEVRRIGRATAILALISYGVMRLEDDLQTRFSEFYRDELGPHWPAERRLVDSGYASIEFPFHELSAPAFEICKSWGLEELLGYISTWSAVRSAIESGRSEMLQRFSNDIAHIWGDPLQQRQVRWPISMRVGRLAGVGA